MKVNRDDDKNNVELLFPFSGDGFSNSYSDGYSDVLGDGFLDVLGDGFLDVLGDGFPHCSSTESFKNGELRMI